MRDDSTNVRLYSSGATFSRTQTSTGISSLNQYILRGGAQSNDSEISCYWMGASLTNTQISNFRIYYNTFLTNVGLTAFA